MLQYTSQVSPLRVSPTRADIGAHQQLSPPRHVPHTFRMSYTTGSKLIPRERMSLGRRANEAIHSYRPGGIRITLGRSIKRLPNNVEALLSAKLPYTGAFFLVSG